MVGVARGHQRTDTLKPYSQKTSQSNHTRTTALSNSMKLSHARGATQDGQVMGERSDGMWSTGEGNGKPLQYCCLENPRNSMKRQNDRILKEELPRSVGVQYATGDQWRNNSSIILGTYQPREFLFQYPIILPFHAVRGVLKARILKWFAIPFSSGPHSVKSLHHDLPVLGCPTGMA